MSLQSQLIEIIDRLGSIEANQENIFDDVREIKNTLQNQDEKIDEIALAAARRDGASDASKENVNKAYMKMGAISGGVVGLWQIVAWVFTALKS